MFKYIGLSIVVTLFLSSCSTTEHSTQEDPVLGILERSTDKAGGQAAWDSLELIKYGHSAILFEEGLKSERNEMHQYTQGENSKKRISFEGTDGALITLAEIQSQYFRFVGEAEDTLVNTDEIGSYIRYSSFVSCLPFSIKALKDKLQYIGTDSITNGISTDVVGLIGDKEKWWFFFSQEEGSLVSFKHFVAGETSLTTINQRQKVNGFEVPMYMKTYLMNANVKSSLREESYYAAWSLK